MPKTEEKQKVSVPEIVEPQALAKTGNSALAVMDGADRKDVRGKENIDASRLLLPRIAGAQKTSPEVDPTSERYIPGLELFQMFNTLTQEVYGNGPIYFTVIRTLPFKAIEFDSDNKVVRPDVKKGDAALEFTEDPRTGKRNRPIATEFKEYLVLLSTGDVAALSFKSTQIKTAEKLDTFMTFRPGASWLGLYKITSKGKTFAKGPATQFTVLPAGPTPAELIKTAEEVFVNTEKVVIDVSRDTTADTADDFEPSKFA